MAKLLDSVGHGSLGIYKFYFKFKLMYINRTSLVCSGYYNVFTLYELFNHPNVTLWRFQGKAVIKTRSSLCLKKED